MRIDKAIEVLSIWKGQNCPPPLFDEFHALQLGIEALRYLKDSRERFPARAPVTLPGETKD